MDRFTKALADFEIASKCAHDFTYQRNHPMNDGVVAVCKNCKCRFTSWPGSVHYDEIVAARDRQKPPTD